MIIRDDVMIFFGLGVGNRRMSHVGWAGEATATEFAEHDLALTGSLRSVRRWYSPSVENRHSFRHAILVLLPRCNIWMCCITWYEKFDANECEGARG